MSLFMQVIEPVLGKSADKMTATQTEKSATFKPVKNGFVLIEVAPSPNSEIISDRTKRLAYSRT